MDVTLPGYQASDACPPPSYRRRPTFHRTDHVFPIKDHQSGSIWATLILQSGAKSPGDPPVYKEGDSIAGVLDLDLQKTNIQHISIRFIGQIIRAISGPRSHEPFRAGPDTFLDVSETLWSRDASGSLDRLDGKHSFPFVMPIPREAPASQKTLPPSLQESYTSFGVLYEVFVLIRRGKLRADVKVGTTVSYLPRIKPETPSPLRQLAYQNGTPIPGPNHDSEGWKALTPGIVKGSVFGHREVQIKCTLFLATPLFYTQGTAIPSVIVLESTDEEALDLLSSPKAIMVRLQRHIIWGTPTKTDKAALYRTSALDYPTTATWDPPSGRGQQRRLEGEIQLSSRLPPSFAYGKFSVKYQVLIFPFISAAFRPCDKTAVAREDVNIANFYADGPRAKQLRPPFHANINAMEMESPLSNLTEVVLSTAV